MISIDRLSGVIVDDIDSAGTDTVIHIAVDGTHSSGKTTPIETFLTNRQLLTPDEYVFASQVRSKAGTTYPYYCVTEKIGASVVPIVVASEMARQYDSWHPGEKVLTDGYNELDQGAITFRSLFMVQTAALFAASFARKLQPNAPHVTAGIITDRTGLSGFAYAEARLPDKAHDQLDLSLNADIDGLMQSSGGVINLRTHTERLTAHCDLVVIPDHREVAFEDDGKRQLDSDFREAVAQNILSNYKRVVGAEKIAGLAGDRATRQQKFEMFVHDAIAAHLM